MWSPFLTNPKKYKSWPQDKAVKRVRSCYVRFKNKNGSHSYRHRLTKEKAFEAGTIEMLKNSMIESFSVWYYCDILSCEAL